MNSGDSRAVSAASASSPPGAPEHETPLTDESLPTEGRPANVTAPEQPGEYEIRYLTHKGATLGRAKLTVAGATASISAPRWLRS